MNTGRAKTGIILLMENHLKKSLHYFICLLHMIELLLKHLFVVLDGGTASAETYVGPIGRKFKEAEHTPIANFTAISMGDFPANFDSSLLTNDQKHLYELANAISRGYCSQELASRKIGATHEARWVTKASRILRIYMSEEQPSIQHRWLTIFIQFIYLPSIIKIKMKPYFFDGARHFFGIIHEINKHRFDLGPKSCQSLLSTLAENGFYGHSEMIIVAMLTDEDKNVQKSGYDLIEKARGRSKQNPHFVLKLELPKIINTDIESYVDLLPAEEDIWEPPSTKEFSDAELSEMINCGETIKLPLIPCHSQHVEYHVQLMSLAVEKVNAHYVDGYMLNTLKSRQHMPAYNRKSDFEPLCEALTENMSSSSLNDTVSLSTININSKHYFIYF